MDLILLIGVAISLFVILITLLLLYRRPSQSKAESSTNVLERVSESIPRRAQIARNQRNRLRVPLALQVQDEDDNSNDGYVEDKQGLQIDDKMGAKKRAKLEAKAEKKAQREIELKLREEKKKKDALLGEERKKVEQKEAEEERKREEAQRLEREEKERQEHEEYLKLKATFVIEEEGYDEIDQEEKQNLLQDFIKYIEENKVVVLEDLAIHFKLKTQEVIDRIAILQSNGTLTGVIDDRGKFIYISEDELKSIAKFIRQRGRISIGELAESSNNLISLSAVTS